VCSLLRCARCLRVLIDKPSARSTPPFAASDRTSPDPAAPSPPPEREIPSLMADVGPPMVWRIGGGGGVGPERRDRRAPAPAWPRRRKTKRWIASLVSRGEGRRRKIGVGFFSGKVNWRASWESITGSLAWARRVVRCGVEAWSSVEASGIIQISLAVRWS
jgi:hypothetical protein